MLGTVFEADDLLDSALDVNECEVQLENKQQEKMYDSLYALGGRFAQVLEWVGEKTQNQSAEMFLCKRYTAPNTVYAVARQKRRKTAYKKPRELSNMDTDDANDAHPSPTMAIPATLIAAGTGTLKKAVEFLLDLLKRSKRPAGLSRWGSACMYSTLTVPRGSPW